MRKMKEIILVVGLVALGSFGGFGMNAGAISCPSDSIRAGENVESLVECNVSKATKTGESEAARLAGDVINAVIPIAAVVAVGVVIAGGYMITMSAGDAGKVKRGKTAIMWGLIGMVVALMAYAIVMLVLDNVF